jgi:hypothetical protein
LTGTPGPDRRRPAAKSLEDAIGALRTALVQLKPCGDARASMSRLLPIDRSRARSASAPRYRATLDGNEQYGELDALRELDRGMERRSRARAARRAQSGTSSSRLPRRPPSSRRDRRVHAIVAAIDEADAAALDMRVPRAARPRLSRRVEQGAARASTSRSSTPRRCAAWNGGAGACGSSFLLGRRTSRRPAGLAVADKDNGAARGAAGLAQRRTQCGHHYIDGMAGAPASEQRAFAAAHPGFYESAHGVTRLAIHGGALPLAPLDVAGFASAALPDFSALSPLQDARPAPLRA